MSVRFRRLYDPRYADAWSELWLKPGAPQEVVDAVYRVLSKQYHPDLGKEDHRAQVRLNAAYREITKQNRERKRREDQAAAGE